ncbi:MAG: hypothetical protein HUJ65_03915, partial [Oscillospiraceae bacterium]|nr:hypothetical protein [Oscillospiraceae bacterium]
DTAGGAVTSVTNDGYSVTFAGDAEKRKTLREICVLGLYSTGLMYAGC